MSDEETLPLDPVSTPLPWQHAVWSRFGSVLSGGRLPHAVLCSGEEGSGRRRFVTALSRYLLCQAPVDGMNCGECKTCALSQSQGHSDWRWIGPAGSSRSIGIDQIREVIQFTTQTSALGKYKVLVVHPADSMTLQAANAFLKCLEEPAADTLILLITRSSFRVPATIRSRCQRVQLPTPDHESAATWLTALNGEATMAHRALAAADGMPMLAYDLLRLEGALDRAEKRQKRLTDLFEGRAGPDDAAAVLGGMETEVAVRALLSHIHRHLRGMPTPQLRQPEALALLTIHSRLRDLERSLASGATPQRDLLAATLASQLCSILGERAA